MNKQIVGCIIVLLLSGCQSMSNGDRLQSFILGDWQVESVMGTPTVMSPANLSFFEDGKIAGNNSCNNFFGKYTVEGDKVKLMPAGSTMMMCPESLMRQAGLIDKAMPLVATAEMKINNLKFLDSAGKSIFILNKL
ncbi:META domain-containing protein [Shewanella sp. D64]|uniref:META domain-containing protein n=1 Tax=unclassified Shewanella TaxID=196818 RepID=UPI0022BA5C5C|nr:MULTISPECIES: META domain-containing protein [unclassified Shewanella]MEC4728620.1 META domain-containing protein [Shewanella sp. D64]MEC4737869.1 META domain-containing protein [Shewanella sp. E94]WBJ93877.1 META domain-containing protein [Shewanella sp. MTB7]